MWLYLIALVLLVVGIVGGVLTGGIFTIALLPLGALVLVSAIVSGVWGRAIAGRAGGQTEASQKPQRPLPHRRPRRGEEGPSSPEQLADARRVQQ
jgi:Na+/H+-translocating membrane pyrophosphatase